MLKSFIQVVALSGLIIGWMVNGITQDTKGDRLGVIGNLGFSSRAIWRGYPLNEEPVLIPEVGAYITAVKDGNLEFAWKGIFDLTDFHGRRREDEFYRYEWRVGFVQKLLRDIGLIGVGLIYYYYPHDPLEDTDTTELYITTEWIYWSPAALKIANRKITDVGAYLIANAYYDVRRVDSGYFFVGTRLGFQLSSQWSMGMQIGVGYGLENYNDYYYGVEESALNNLQAAVLLGGKIGQNSGVRLGLEYHHLIDSDIRRAIRNDPDLHPNNLVFKMEYIIEF